MGAINTIRQESVKLLQLEDGLLKLIDTEPMRVPENRNFTIDYLKSIGVFLGCGIVTLLFVRDMFGGGDFLAKLIGLVCILGFAMGALAGLAMIKTTKEEQAKLARDRKEAIDFNNKLEADKKVLATAYNSQQANLRKAKQLVPELKNRPLFFDRDLEHSGTAGASYVVMKDSYMRLSGEPVLRPAHFNDRDTLIFDGYYPDKRCLVKEALDVLSKQDYYYLVWDDALIAENLNTVCNFNLITDNNYFEYYLTNFVGGDTNIDPHVRLAVMHTHYTEADYFILGGTGGHYNYSSVPDTRDDRTPATEIPKRIDPKELSMRHRNYKLLTLRLGYTVSIPNPWRILCVAVPKFGIRQQFWTINRIQGWPDKYGKEHLVGELIGAHDEIAENAENKDVYPDPVRVAEYLVSDSYRLRELPPFDPFQPPPNGMNPDVWRTILRTWSTARPVIQSDNI